MLTVSLSPSRVLLVFQLVLHGSAATAIAISSLELHWQLIIDALMLASLRRAVIQMQLNGVDSVRTVVIETLKSRSRQPDENGQQSTENDNDTATCIITVPPDRRLPARLTWFYCLAWIQLLAFYHRRKIYIAIVLPDSAPAWSRRQLRTYLRSSACFNSLARI